MATKPAEVALTVAAAVPLCHAFAARVAEECDVRAVAIKGPVLAIHELRAPRSSSDVDVLVDPARFEDYCAGLGVHGWVERNARSAPAVLPLHSRTFINPHWPCDIDVHWYYPGLFADAGEIFERLWSDHVVMSIANYPVPAASRSASILIAALHDLRNPGSERHMSELKELRNRLASLPPAERSGVHDLAVAWRSQSTLREFLVDQGMTATEDLSPRELMSWRIKVATSEDGTSAGWLVALLDASPRERCRLIFRAIWPSAREMKLDVVAGPQTRSEVYRSRWDRLRRALRTLPHVTGVVLKERSVLKRSSRPGE